MKPLDALFNLLQRIAFTDRWRNQGPGKVVERASVEEREALSNLKSDEIGNKLRVEDYYMMDAEYELKNKSLEREKELGIRPPPRKKYEEY
jgi:hypothetical protein